jgi:hypothetical protein
MKVSTILNELFLEMTEIISPAEMGSRFEKVLDKYGHIEAKESGWQPIESAPKQGKMILCWDGSHINKGYHSGLRGWKVAHNSNYKGGFNPTHWMPLPEPPDKQLANSGSQENDALEDTEKKGS